VSDRFKTRKIRTLIITHFELYLFVLPGFS